MFVYIYIYIYICMHMCIYRYIYPPPCPCGTKWSASNALSSPCPWLVPKGLGPPFPDFSGITCVSLLSIVFGASVFWCLSGPIWHPTAPKTMQRGTHWRLFYFGNAAGNMKQMLSCTRSHYFEGWRGSQENFCAALCTQCFSRCFSERAIFDVLPMLSMFCKFSPPTHPKLDVTTVPVFTLLGPGWPKAPPQGPTDALNLTFSCCCVMFGSFFHDVWIHF